MPKPAIFLALVLLVQLGSLRGESIPEETFTLLGGQPVEGPVTIRDSTVGDIINITVNINGTVHSEITVELLTVLVGALNQYGNYGITMSDLRGALVNYVSKQNGYDGQ